MKKYTHLKERLFRKVLFFDKNGNEVKAGTEYDGDIFVVSHTLDSNDESGSSAVIVSKKEDYYILFLKLIQKYLDLIMNLMYSSKLKILN